MDVTLTLSMAQLMQIDSTLRSVAFASEQKAKQARDSHMPKLAEIFVQDAARSLRLADELLAAATAPQGAL